MARTGSRSSEDLKEHHQAAGEQSRKLRRVQESCEERVEGHPAADASRSALPASDTASAYCSGSASRARRSRSFAFANFPCTEGAHRLLGGVSCAAVEVADASPDRGARTAGTHGRSCWAGVPKRTIRRAHMDNSPCSHGQLAVLRWTTRGAGDVARNAAAAGARRTGRRGVVNWCGPVPVGIRSAGRRDAAMSSPPCWSGQRARARRSGGGTSKRTNGRVPPDP